MGNFGAHLDWTKKDVGLDIKLVGDVSIGYEFPFYSENSYTVLESIFNALGGGKSHITISLFFFRVTIFAETIGFKFSPAVRAKFDVINYNKVCT